MEDENVVWKRESRRQRNTYAKRLTVRMPNICVTGRSIMIDGEVRICGAFEKNLTFGFSKKD